jgi:predicted MPP superfamily phosphohydrolase
MRSVSLRFVARLALGAVVPLLVWVFLFNRILNWEDRPLKWILVVALVPFMGALGVVPVARGWRGPWSRVWVGVLVLFLLGEGRRAWLRREYRASTDAPSADLLHPVTTTDLEVRRFEISVLELPADRVRVVQISDVHMTESLPFGYFEDVARRIGELEPDLVFMTGDYVTRADRLPLFERWVHEMPRGRFGAFAVLGNHDYWDGVAEDVRAALVGAGVRVLSGGCDDVRVDEGTLRVCGTEQPWGPGFEARRTDGATLVLTHSPDNIYDLAETKGVTAVFAGHTHGGQVRVPFLGSVVIPSRYGRRFDEGHFLVDGTHLFVSAGVGADMPPLRLWCPPDLVAVDLVRPAIPTARR